MTTEEAINIMKVIVHMLEEKYDTDRVEDALDMAIKALEQQPCEDCISRKDVNVLVDELARAISDERCCISRGRSTATIMQDILELPSIQPTRPTGKWIEKEDYNLDTYYECSECGADYCIEGDILIHKYCPNCGAKMNGVETEEEDER